MKKILLLMLTLGLVASTWYWLTGANVGKEEKLEAAFENNDEVSSAPKDIYEVAVITNPNGSYGYDVLKNGKRFIHQPMIPGIAGNTGFSSIEQANVVGELVVSKLEQSIMPPSVNKEELQQLNVL